MDERTTGDTHDAAPVAYDGTTWPHYGPATPGACGATYSESHPFTCDAAAGHDGPHEDRHADAPSVVAWKGHTAMTFDLETFGYAAEYEDGRPETGGASDGPTPNASDSPTDSDLMARWESLGYEIASSDVPALVAAGYTVWSYGYDADDPDLFTTIDAADLWAWDTAPDVVASWAPFRLDTITPEDIVRRFRTDGPTLPTMPRWYVVQGMRPDGRQVPTFYLSADTQGITSTDAAVRIARDILGDDDANLWAYPAEDIGSPIR